MRQNKYTNILALLRKCFPKVRLNFIDDNISTYSADATAIKVTMNFVVYEKYTARVTFDKPLFCLVGKPACGQNCRVSPSLTANTLFCV